MFTGHYLTEDISFKGDNTIKKLCFVVIIFTPVCLIGAVYFEWYNKSWENLIVVFTCLVICHATCTYMIQGVSIENLKLLATEKDKTEEYIKHISNCTDAYTVVDNQNDLLKRTEPLGKIRLLIAALASNLWWFIFFEMLLLGFACIYRIVNGMQHSYELKHPD